MNALFRLGICSNKVYILVIFFFIDLKYEKKITTALEKANILFFITTTHMLYIA